MSKPQDVLLLCIRFRFDPDEEDLARRFDQIAQEIKPFIGGGPMDRPLLVDMAVKLEEMIAILRRARAVRRKP